MRKFSKFLKKNVIWIASYCLWGENRFEIVVFLNNGKTHFQIDAKKSEPTSFIFTSQNLATADFIMMIIHGTGVVRAGQWSRKFVCSTCSIDWYILLSSSSRWRLIINEGLTIGSQIEYIRRAEQAGYAVIVTNTNYNRVESPRNLRSRSSRSIRVSDVFSEISFFFLICFLWVLKREAKLLKLTVNTFGNILSVQIQQNMFFLWLIRTVEPLFWRLPRNFNRNSINESSPSLWPIRQWNFTAIGWRKKFWKC